MKRPEKEAVVAQLTDKFREADAIYLTEYRGLTVPQISELREKLGRDTSYTVAKNTAAYLFNALPTKAVRTIDALREKQEKAA